MLQSQKGTAWLSYDTHFCTLAASVQLQELNDSQKVVKHLRFRAVGRQRMCQKCRRPMPNTDAEMGRCSSCLEPGTFAHSFGRAMAYARTKYKFLPNDLEARAMLHAWKKFPFCWRYGTKFNDAKLVFAKIMKKSSVCAESMIVVRMDAAMERHPIGIRNIAEIC